MKLLSKSKKGGVFDQLGAMAIGVATLAIVLVITFLILATGQDQLVTIDTINESNTSTWSTGYNATRTLTDAVQDIPGWVPIVIVAGVGAVLLSMVALFKRS